MVAAGDWEMSGIRSLPIPASLSYYIASHARASLFFRTIGRAPLFQRGAFVEADTKLVAWVQAVYLLQVPVFVLGMLLRPADLSSKGNRALMWGQA